MLLFRDSHATPRLEDELHFQTIQQTIYNAILLNAVDA